ncbi:MAG: DNA photolyase family protein, partial [Ectothiorhodospiraceae bacterium]|nr:DNA photolyase family protein [Ectothiorhodospiraceae bacterium]
MTVARPCLVWLRRDLRLADNPALHAAASRGPVIPVYLHAPTEQDDWPEGGASRWWLHHSLERLGASLVQRQSQLIIRRCGDSLEALRELARETGAGTVYWNRLYEPAAIARDRRIKTALREDGLEAASFNARLLREPWEVRKQEGGSYRAFTPFWRNLRKLGPDSAPLDVPRLPTHDHWPTGEAIADLDLLPAIPWYRGFEPCWTPGEDGAQQRLDAFLRERLSGYGGQRDLPACDSTSGLSPHLHFGEIGPRQVWASVQASRLAGSGDAEKFLAEVGWREFAHHLLYHNPGMPTQPLDRRFEDFPWARDADDALEAWQHGRTGIPIVDAGMRQLWETGWMHNRVRMIVGSLLTKNLRIPWQRGEAWFWDTLVDADLANNSMGWQWIQGCGADAAPYFRIFNPVRQGERFDPDGDYVRRWVPELGKLPAEHIHQPWKAPGSALEQAGLRLGSDYPPPIVDLKESRQQALDA